MGISIGNRTTSILESEIDNILDDTDKTYAQDIKDEWNAMKDSDTTIEGMGHAKNISKDIKDISGGIDSAIKSNEIDGRSIIARSRNSVLQFPVYVTQSIRVNEASIIARLFERVYASYVQSALAQNPIVDESEVNNLLFLQKFHTNIRESAEFELYNEYYSPIDDLDQIMKDAEYHVEQVTPNMDLVFRFCPTKDAHLYKENGRLINEPLAGLKYLQEADVTHDTHRTAGDSRIEERYKKINQPVSDDELKKLAKENQELDDVKKDIREGKIKGYHYISDDKGNRYVKEVLAYDGRTKTNTSRAANPVDAPILLKEVEVKKLNDMLPYTIEATFRVRNKENNVSYDAHFLIGVKTVMHLIRVNDLQDDLRDLVMGNIKSLQKVRYKTGEIKFADYLFNFKGLKADAAKRVNYNKRWITSLKRLADWNKLHGTSLKNVNDVAFNGKIPIPNGTMILSQSDITTLTANTGIDLSKVSNAKRLAKSLFLIAVAIVDPSAGSMKVLFPDNDNDWDVQSLASIDAELAKTDNSQIMRELNRIVNK